MLYGREAERRQLAAVVASVRAGRAGVLAILGDPGAGKSALLEDLVAGVESDPQEPTVRILTTTGVAAEAPLPFAALHRLLRPVLAWRRIAQPNVSSRRRDAPGAARGSEPGRLRKDVRSFSRSRIDPAYRPALWPVAVNVASSRRSCD
ncbi:MAG: ATP-binding protein [Propionicimonas sp.]